ncbi:hypothetical protein CPB85DRAFT_1304550 [Mucidula mucida]|nr:hypothetical protein CPB85DRAFT_1304550 [Mucidula mucida]
MRWLAPPDRRELTLLIFALTIFTLAYNFSTSISYAATPSVLLTRLGFGGSKIITDDGRRLPKYRDPLEDFIYGDFEWEKGHIAGHGFERSQELGVGDHSATWISSDDHGVLNRTADGESVSKQGFWAWGDEVPVSTLVKHTPGYSIVDNVIIFQGTDYPSVHSIVSARGPGRNNWEIITTLDARERFGTYGGILKGVTWLVADPVADNATLPALWRTYSSLDSDIDAQGRTKLPPPQRLFFPHMSVFTDEPRRSDTGFHPYAAKIALPRMDVMFRDDWEDFHYLEFPFVIERVVVADRTAASHLTTHPAPHASAFEHTGSPYWWEPIRQNVHAYFADHVNKKKKVVTYIERQVARNGARLRSEDHTALIKGLAKLASSYGCEVHVVSAFDEETSWKDRLASVVQSTVVLGVHDGDMMDAVYMKTTPQTTLIEMFPPKTYVRDREVVVRGLGMRYVGLDNERCVVSS